MFGQQVLILAVLLDVDADKGTDGNDLEPLSARVVQHGFDKLAADALPAQARRHIHIGQDESVLFALVIQKGSLAFDLKLKARFFRVVLNRARVNLALPGLFIFRTMGCWLRMLGCRKQYNLGRMEKQDQNV